MSTKPHPKLNQNHLFSGQDDKVVSCHETGQYVLGNPYVVVYSVSPAKFII